MKNSFGFWSQIKDQNAKKAKEMDPPHQIVSSENVLLSERGFMSEQDIAPFANGSYPDWKENFSDNSFPSQKLHSKVCMSGLWKSSYRATV